MIVWVIGRLVNPGIGWVLEGIEVSEVAARARCADATWFIGPVTIAEPLPAGEHPWPGAYYPCAS